MILSNINRLEYKFYPQTIQKALELIKTTDFSKEEYGKYEVDGSDIFYFYHEFDTKEVAETHPEIHDKYIDIQYVAKGKEKIGYAERSDDYSVFEDKMADGDILFYDDVKDEVMLNLHEGDFAVFFPEDAHRPLIKAEGSDKVTKVIFKIKLDAIK